MGDTGLCTELSQPEAASSVVGVGFLRRTRCSSQDSHLPVRKNILLLRKALPEDQPDSRKQVFRFIYSRVVPTIVVVTGIGLWSCCPSSLVLYLVQIGLLLQMTGFIHYTLMLSLFTFRD